MDELPFGADIPAWLLWCVTAVLCLFGRPSWARWPAVLGVAAYLAAQVVEYSVNNFQTVANALGWLGVQVIAAIALASPAWVVHGRSQVRRWRAAAIGVTAAGAALAVSSVDHLRLSTGPTGYLSWLWLVTALLALVAGGAALRSAEGRAVLPLGAGLAAFMVTAKYLAYGLAGDLGNNVTGQSGPRGHLESLNLTLLVVTPLLMFIATRAVTAGANSRFPPAQPTMSSEAQQTRRTRHGESR
ncbi:hypothetical protein ABIB25_005199 [Nakamurella sp. UYEF19]|uniref:hypothetical protein n=1 Tax=Nakamurella sp. UYEF19 TaxID=1756392 RepID=UPI003399FD1F